MASKKSKRKLSQPRSLSYEPLESRRVMAVVISEFLAANDSGIEDAAGHRHDWIELENTGPATANVSGWYLTDDPLLPTKWQLPATAETTSLAPGERLLVFASGNNGELGFVGDELHANFQLAREGGYLALANGLGTVVDSFELYPEQFADVSYGAGVTDASTVGVTLVGNASPLSVISPTGPDADRDDHWKEVGYNDSGWLTGTGSVGFDRNGSDVNLAPYIGRTLSAGEMNPNGSTQQYSAYVRYEFDVADKEQLTSLAMNLRFDDGFIAYLNGREIARANFAEDFVYPQPQWNSYAGHQQGSSSSSGNWNRREEAADVVSFELSPYLYLLEDENNVLAFHGVTSRSTGSGDHLDFLIDASLTAQRATTGGQLGYLAAPTPESANGLSTLGFVADTKFSHDRGFYDSAFNLVITTATPGAAIHYTTDGSAPTTSSPLFSGSISIDPATIADGERGVVMIRAAALKDGYVSSNVDTQTYIFLDKVIKQNGSGLPDYATWGHDSSDDGSASGFELDDEPDWEMDPEIVAGNEAALIDALKSIPTVSLVTNWDFLWSGDAKPGTPEEDADGNGRVAFEPVGIYIHGRSDERPTSLEYFTSDGSEAIQVDATFEIQGHSSPGRWRSDKLSFQVKFKSPFGDAKLDHPLFVGAADGENALTQFDTFILDAGFNYWWHHANTSVQADYARFVADQVTADLQNLASGNAAPHGKHVHLYLDGVYWGLYNLHERPDEHFAAGAYGGSEDDYYVVKHSTNDVDGIPYTWVNGGLSAEAAYQSLIDRSRLVSLDPGSDSLYEEVESQLDVEQFIDYMLVHYYAGNENDWPHNNWYATFNAVEADGKWRFHAWDQEHAFPTDDNGDSFTQFLDLTDDDDSETPAELLHNLILNDEFRLKFADRTQELLRNGGVLTEAAAAAAYEARIHEISAAILGESARWGDNRNPDDPYTQQDFLNVNVDNTTGDQKAVLTDFFPVRTTVLLSQIAANGWETSLDAPIWNQYGGEIAAGFGLTMNHPNASGNIYYTLDGADPRHAATNGLSAGALAYSGTITLNDSTQVKARVRLGNTGSTDDWSPLVDKVFLLEEALPLRIVELNYHPAEGSQLEFIELLNIGSEMISLDGVQIADFANDAYVFEAGQSLAAGERIVVARNPSDFVAHYGAGINLASGAGYANANLSNGGETISLRDSFGVLLQSFSYDDAGDWPTSPDGNGRSLEYVGPLDADAANPADVAGDPYDVAANWWASVTDGGSPGAARASADFNGDGAVNGRDMMAWLRGFGAGNSKADGDADNNGVVNGVDLGVWEIQFDAVPENALAASEFNGFIADLALPIRSARTVEPLIEESLSIEVLDAVEHGHDLLSARDAAIVELATECDSSAGKVSHVEEIGIDIFAMLVDELLG